MERLPPVHRSEADKQALQWFLETHDDADLSAARWELFLRWLQAHPQHERLLNQYEALWVQMSELEAEHEFFSYALEEQKAARTTLVKRALSWFNPTVPWLLATCLALLFITTYYYRSGEDYDTGVGQQKVVSLRDGSTLTLNTDSSLRVRFLPWQRTVILKHGEAFFAVAHEKWRPFWVEVGGGRIRAVGTRFGVRKENDSVTVLLVEGRVLVNTVPEFNDQFAPQSQMLLPGEYIHYAGDGIQSRAEQGNVLALTQWTTGRLSFTAASLSAVVRELNRYSLEKVRIGDPTLEGEKISAYFEIGRIGNFVTGLHYLIGIDYYRDAQSRIVLVRKVSLPAGTERPSRSATGK
jgi:transmembrane sensor